MPEIDAMSEIDIDLLRSASHRSMTAHLSGPFAGGARDSPLTLDAEGRAEVAHVTRHPLVVVAPKAEVGPAGLEFSAHVITGSGTGPAVTVRFAPFTEAGAFLPVHHPDPLLPASEQTPPFTVALAREGADAPDTALAELVELRLIEGVLGRLLYALGAEKQRIRRQARELFAVRRLPHAFGDALDRLGAELGVPRFTDRLAWDAEQGEPTSVTERETDADYRRRLGLYRPFLMATRRRVLERINGPGGALDGNAGPLAGLGFTERFALQEANSEFAVAIRLVGPAREDFMQHLRHVHLLAPAEPVPAHRLLPGPERQRQEDMLARLRSQFEIPAEAWMAPGLAWALDRVGRCRAALQVTRPWRVLRAHDESGGSRYELGLGVDVETPPADELALLVENLTQRQFAAGTELEIVELLDSLAPVAPAEDPAGRWLLDACGLRTVHALPGGSYYLSHVSVHGLTIEDGSAPNELEVRFHAPGDAGPDTLLFHGLADAEADAAAQGWPAWTRLAAPDAQAAWATAVAPSEDALAAFDAAGLRTPGTSRDVQRAVTALGQVPGELLVTLSLDAGLAAGIMANQGDAVAVLQQMIAAFRRHELVSVLPLVTSAPGVLLVVGVTALPGRAALLNARREGFRWYVLPVAGDPLVLRDRVGSRNHYTAPAEPGLTAVVAVALARQGRSDPRGSVLPYQVRVALPPEDARLDLAQYELLMNLLAHMAPAGVTIDTHTLRTQHVDPNGQGTVVPFTGPLSHGFRTFRQRRQPGERDTPTAK